MILALAMILDALMGEPKWLWDNVPHPAVLMGRLIDWADEEYNQGEDRKRNGILLIIALNLGALLLGLILQWLPGFWAELLVAAALLAQKSLAQHVGSVAQALRLSVGDARLSVAKIVGRDTKNMDGPAITRATIESAAENFSDAVVAPVFWYLLLGLPGLLAYKITNTADSMVGYLSDKHRDFGWATARFDDVVNWIPARLSALLIWATAPTAGQFNAIREDAALHRSPNAGWPEAAMARVLNVALSGPRSYGGKMQDFPFVNEDGLHASGPREIDASVAVLWRAWAILLGVVLLIWLVRLA